MATALEPGLHWLEAAALIPAPWNPRHNAITVGKLAEAFTAGVAWADPVVVWAERGMVLAGNSRLLAAQQVLKRSQQHSFSPDAPAPGTIPCYVLSVSDEAEAKRICVRSNKMQENSRWDEAALQKLLLDLPPDGRMLLGWEAPQLAALLPSAQPSFRDPLQPIQAPKRGPVGGAMATDPPTGAAAGASPADDGDASDVRPKARQTNNLSALNSGTSGKRLFNFGDINCVLPARTYEQFSAIVASRPTGLDTSVRVAEMLELAIEEWSRRWAESGDAGGETTEAHDPDLK